jgi:hypothetical protein
LKKNSGFQKKFVTHLYEKVSIDYGRQILQTICKSKFRQLKRPLTKAVLAFDADCFAVCFPRR